jgi:hypothetical protein
MKHGSITDLPLLGWFAIALVLLAQSCFLFIDARKREVYPWFWGIYGLISFPLPTLLYLIFVRKLFRKPKQ